MAAPDAGAVLVCGLGSLGIECVVVLQGYGVEVRAIDLGESCPDGITFVRGDCRQPEVLRRAGIASCRGVVLVTGDARANVEAALATRRLSPSIRIVARAAQDNINQLLSTLLGNFVAYDPGRLAAGALALAASTGETIGYFRVEGRLVRVLRRRVLPGDRWRGAEVKQLERHGLFVLEHDADADGDVAVDAANPAPPLAATGGPSPRRLFHRYDPERTIEEGDTLTLLTVEDEVAKVSSSGPAPGGGAFGDWLTALPSSLRRPAGVVLASFAAIAVALTVSAIAFPAGERSLSTIDGVFTALVLMTGGTYADLFPPFNHLSNGLRLLSVTLSAIGTVFVGLLYAWLTERLMTLRLRLGPRRPPPPRGDHVVIVGLGRVGRQATAVLQQLDHPLAGIELQGLDDHSLPRLSVIKGNGTEVAALAAAHIAEARAVLAATPDEWINLEIALQVRRLNPDCELVIRTRDIRFSRNIADIIPRMRALCVPEIAAKAFAAGALGGKVLDLFQLDDRTVFVVEHQVKPGDGLDGRFLAEAAEGYSVVPIWYDAGGHPPRFWTPAAQAVRLGPGDRVVLLGRSSSLQWIERSEMHPREVFIRLSARRPYADPLAVAAILVQHTGCTLEVGLGLLQALPRDLPHPLYPQQAHRLQTALEASGTTTERFFRDPSSDRS